MALAALLGAVGQLIMKLVGQDLAAHGFSLQTGLWFLAVFGLYGGVMVLFMKGLQLGREMSTTYPAYSLTFVWAALLAYFVLGETLHFLQIVGIIVICAGVALINMPKIRITRSRNHRAER